MLVSEMFADANFVNVCPLETDPPSSDLYDGSGPDTGVTQAEMGRCTILRHGVYNPASAPRDFDTRQRMPGAINLALTDGHVELVKLENLWNYTWHWNWITPVPRPQ